MRHHALFFLLFALSGANAQWTTNQNSFWNFGSKFTDGGTKVWTECGWMEVCGASLLCTDSLLYYCMQCDLCIAGKCIWNVLVFVGILTSYVHWLCINISQRLESATLKNCLLLPIACSFQSYCSPAVVAAYDHLSHLIGSAITHEEQKWAASSM